MSASAIAAKLKLKRQAPEQQAPSSSKASRTEAPAAAPAPVTFAEGEAVLGNFKGMGDWDEAVVVGVKPGGLYVLDYTDEGLIEEDVPASRIMRQGGAGAADVAEALAAAPAPPAAAGASSNDGRADAAGGSAAGRGGAGGGAGGAKPASSESESEEEEEESPEFLKSSVWRGHRPGYVFKRGVLSGGEAALGYFKDVPLLEKHEAEEAERMQLSAAQLSNWLLEALPEAPSVDKADRCFRLFDLKSLRVGSLEQSSSPPLFGSLAEWFDAQRALYATKVPSEAVQVLLRVFLEPQQALRLGLHHASFSIDWMSVSEEAAAEPISGALLRRLGMASRRPRRMLLVVMYKAERSRITQVWAEMDREGLALKKGAQLDDVLVSDCFDRALNAARRAGATGELNPIFTNYHSVPVIG